jgi:hypothetical protein
MELQLLCQSHRMAEGCVACNVTNKLNNILNDQSQQGGELLDPWHRPDATLGCIVKMRM